MPPSCQFLCLIETITQICGRQFLPHEYVHVQKGNLTHHGGNHNDIMDFFLSIFIMLP